MRWSLVPAAAGSLSSWLMVSTNRHLGMVAVASLTLSINVLSTYQLFIQNPSPLIMFLRSGELHACADGGVV
jgi:hypothetical protein